MDSEVAFPSNVGLLSRVLLHARIISETVRAAISALFVAALALLFAPTRALWGLLSSSWPSRSSGRDGLRRILAQRMRDASSYREWHEAALLLDGVEGLNEWKRTIQSDLYDGELILTRLSLLRSARLRKDIEGLAFLVRAGMARTVGGIDARPLYTHCFVGTKAVIEDYVEEMSHALADICEAEGAPRGVDKGRFFSDARQAFGRTALVLSGGASLGMYHFGVVKCLREFGLLPRVLCGTAIGAIVAACIGIHRDEDMDALFEPNAIDFSAFQGLERGSAKRKIARLLKEGMLMDSGRLAVFIKANIGTDVTFLDAYQRTGRIINITVASTERSELPRLLNYLTAPNVLIWSAALASCSSPLFYASVQLKARDSLGNHVDWNPASRPWPTASIEADLPMARLAELFNINHLIVSQVNPEVIPFMTGTRRTLDSGWAAGLRHLALSEATHRVNQLAALGVIPRKLQPVLTQHHEGDVTIVPDIGWRQLLRVLSNPSEEALRECLRVGERSTWPYISAIHTRYKIEMALDRCHRIARGQHGNDPRDIERHREVHHHATLSHEDPGETHPRPHHTLRRRMSVL
eukprot:Opistho-1_new@37894